MDDILTASKKVQMRSQVVKELSILFNATELGSIRNYLSIQVIKDKNNKFVIHQKKHINQILITHGLTQTKASIRLQNHTIRLQKHARQ